MTADSPLLEAGCSKTTGKERLTGKFGSNPINKSPKIGELREGYGRKHARDRGEVQPWAEKKPEEWPAAADLMSQSFSVLMSLDWMSGDWSWGDPSHCFYAVLWSEYRTMSAVQHDLVLRCPDRFPPWWLCTQSSEDVCFYARHSHSRVLCILFFCGDRAFLEERKKINSTFDITFHFNWSPFLSKK